MSSAHVLEGASPLAPDETVDPGSICEVEFSISARGRADIEFFNRIGHQQSLDTGSGPKRTAQQIRIEIGGPTPLKKARRSGLSFAVYSANQRSLFYAVIENRAREK